jgi:hypothetical protein
MQLTDREWKWLWEYTRTGSNTSQAARIATLPPTLILIAPGIPILYESTGLQPPLISVVICMSLSPQVKDPTYL